MVAVPLVPGYPARYVDESCRAESCVPPPRQLRRECSLGYVNVRLNRSWRERSQLAELLRGRITRHSVSSTFDSITSDRWLRSSDIVARD